MIFALWLLSGVSLALVLILHRRVSQLNERLDAAERAIGDQREIPEEPPALEGRRVLEGLRIGLAIAQDHVYPAFANLLKEQLLKQDVADVLFLPSSCTTDEWRASGKADLLIAGAITCNGYVEVYYQADLTCYSTTETVCTLIERPPGGDRPENLAMEVVTKLSDTLDKVLKRDERRRAIGELHGL